MTEKEVKAFEERYGVEISVLKKLGMKWAVLVSLSQTLNKKGNKSEVADREIQLAKAMIESGCFTTCDVECVLTDIERELIPIAFSIEQEQADKWVNLLGKAMKGELTPDEVLGLPFIEPLIQSCQFLQCACGKGSWF